MTEHSRHTDYKMEDHFEAGEPAHFRAFADPTRQRIVSLLYERAATTKQLAVMLELSPGTIGHHLKVLEEAGLIRVVRTRKVRAITEKYYGNTYRQVRFTGRGFTWREELPEVEPMFMFRQAMDEYDEAALYEEKGPVALLPMSTSGRARIPASRAEEFARKVIELSEEFEELGPVAGERVYAFVAGVFRTNLPELPENDRGGD